MLKSEKFEKFMDKLYEKYHMHFFFQAEDGIRDRNIEPESGRFLSMLIRVQQSKNILEIGTSTGYSTLWLAEAARQTQAMITTLELDAERIDQAKQNATEINLADLINFKVEDAQVYLQETQEVFDFILLD